jgi:type II secretory pathway pseudopilin PulG
VARRLRAHLRSESGMTLAELAIAMILVGIVISIFSGILFSVQRGFERESERSQSNDQARLAVEELDREIRSGNVLYDPFLENDPANGIVPGMSLRIYTQSNANTRPGFRCVQWRITSAQELQRRAWPTNWRDDPGNLVSGWRVVADHVVNRSDNPTVTAFALDNSDASYGNRLVSVTIVVNENPSAGQDVRIQSSVEGRDTTFGYPNSACADIPPY